MPSNTSPGGLSEPPAESSPPLLRSPRFTRLLVYAAAYCAVGLVGVGLSLDPVAVASFWPASGLLLALLLSHPTRSWPAIAVATLPGHVAAYALFGKSWGAATSSWVADSAQALVGAWLLRRFVAQTPSLCRLRSVVGLVGLGALVGSAIPAVAAAVLAGRLGVSSAHVRQGVIVGLGHALGVLAAAPPLLAWSAGAADSPTAGRSWRRVEAGLLGAAMAACSWVAFGELVPRSEALALVLVPGFVWSALRFGARGAAAIAAVVSHAAMLALARSAAAHDAQAAAVTTVQVELSLVSALAAVLVLAAVLEERRAAARAAREGEELFSQFMTHCPWLVCVSDASSRTIALSEGFAAIARRPLGELLGKSIAELIPGAAGEEIRRDEQRVLAQGHAMSFTYKLGHRSYLCVKFPIVRPGRPPLVGGLTTDVTEYRMAEAGARMAAIGTLASGVAHEINNPLAAVLTNIEVALDQLRAMPGSEHAQEPLTDAKEGALRVREVVRRLRSSAPGRGGPLAAVDVRAAVRAALVLKQQEIRGCARLVQDLPEVPLVMAREKHLVQVFVNLLENAMHALPPERPEANEISVRSFLAPQRRVVVEVADTGTGILPEVRARMFDPFFTTKEIGKGMGLGLFMCHGIVAALGGEMDVDSEPGRGTSIRVILPAASAQA